MANISISNVEFQLSISDKFQEQLDKARQLSPLFLVLRA